MIYAWHVDGQITATHTALLPALLSAYPGRSLVVLDSERSALPETLEEWHTAADATVGAWKAWRQSAGATINGVTWATTVEARGLVTGATMLAQIATAAGQPFATLLYDAAGQPHTLDAAAMLALSVAIAAAVQAPAIAAEQHLAAIAADDVAAIRAVLDALEWE